MAAKENKPAFVTISLIVLNLLAFLALPLVFKQYYPSNPIVFGANWGPLTLTGQWWRLLSSVFVHIEIVHLVANMILLYWAGKRLERLVGCGVFLLIYLGSAGAMNLMILAINPNQGSYGASAGVAGVIGALSIIYLCRLKGARRDRKKMLIFYGLVLSYIVYADLSAPTHGVHVAALATGAILAWLLIRFGNDTRHRVAIAFSFFGMLVLVAAVVSYHFKHSGGPAIIFGAGETVTDRTSRFPTFYSSAAQLPGVSLSEFLEI